MHQSIAHLNSQARLRYHAESKLRNGTAPRTHGWTVGCDALGILYRLASNPDSAAEGLKLLHELQAHQVELDLQHEQLEANEVESARVLARYKALFDFAPIGYVIVGHDGRILESNLPAAALFGVDRDELCGRAVESFLRAESRHMFGNQLNLLFSGTLDISCIVQSDEDGSDSRRLQITANLAPGGQAVLMMVAECERSSVA